MELKELINDLLESGILENQELAVTLLRSPEVTDEEKEVFIDQFVKDYASGKSQFFKDEHKELFKMWVELYLPTIKNKIKNRVKKII